MKSLIDDAQLLDALLPFSFVTDPHGTILSVGRSLHKVCPSVESLIPFREVFSVQQPEVISGCCSISQLCGELVVLSQKDDPGLKLRGQVVHFQNPESRFVFALQPILLKIEDVVELGVDFSDFAIGDPVFDALIFTQAQRAARESLATAKTRLEWENTSAQLLHRLTVETYDLADALAAYSIAIRIICQFLSWEVGHVYIRESSESPRLVSSSLWYLSAPQRFHELKTNATRISLAEGEGIAGQVLQTHQTIWVSNLHDYSSFPHLRSIKHLPHLTAVGVPVMLDNEVIAVLEFFTERKIPQHDGMLRLFEMIGYQLSAVVARQRAVEKEEAQATSLAQASKMATLGELAAGIAHEIRNPVSTVAMIIEIVKRAARNGVISSDELAPQLDRLSLCVDRISKIISELQTFSRDSSRDNFEIAPLEKLIEQSISLCEARFKKDGVRLVVEPVPSAWALECRDSQISQVILNLLGNALDAALEAKERWVKLAVKDLGDSFELSITDSGLGIQDTIADKILKPFFTTKPAGKGTGLGLSISHKIVVEHSGELVLDRSSSHTRFLVRLPKRHPCTEPLQAQGM